MAKKTDKQAGAASQLKKLLEMISKAVESGEGVVEEFQDNGKGVGMIAIKASDSLIDAIDEANTHSESMFATNKKDAVKKAAERIKELKKSGKIPQGNDVGAILMAVTRSGITAHLVNEDGKAEQIALDDKQVRLDEMFKVMYGANMEKSHKPDPLDVPTDDLLKASVINSLNELHVKSHEMVDALQKTHEALQAYKTVIDATGDSKSQVKECILCWEDVAKLMLNEHVRLCIFLEMVDNIGIPGEAKTTAMVN